MLLDACGSTPEGCAAELEPLADAAMELGVVFKPECEDTTNVGAALAMWLFDSTAATTLPGGYDSNELSSRSPVAQVASFPQALVFVGRSTVLIRGLANRLRVPWSLAHEWAPAARLALAAPEERAAAQAALQKAMRQGALARWLAKLSESVFKALLKAIKAIAAAFAPAFAHMRYTRPTEGCAFTP